MSCCRWTMPLGRPVEPDEYIQNAISLRCVSASASSLAKPSSHGSAAIAFGAACTPTAPFTTISVRSAVSLQASASKREQNPASATATDAPLSAISGAISTTMAHPRHSRRLVACHELRRHRAQPRIVDSAGAGDVAVSEIHQVELHVL